MGNGTIGTTNLLLGFLVVIGVLEAVALAVAIVVMMRVQARLLETMRDISQQLRPLTERANAIADVCEGVAADVKHVTARVAAGADHAGLAIQTAVGVASIGSGRMGTSILTRALPVLSIARALRVAYTTFVGSGASERRRLADGHRRGPAPASPRARPHTYPDTKEVAHGA